MSLALCLISVLTVVYLQVYKARDVGVNSVVLFPKVPDALKVTLIVHLSILFCSWRNFNTKNHPDIVHIN